MGTPWACSPAAELRSSKVGHGYVQGRTKAGGWSQQRFARRRSNQADRAYAAAAEAAYAVLGPVAADLEAVVGGGDRSGVEAVLADPRLAPLRARLTGRVLPTPDPRLDVLRRFGDTPARWRSPSTRWPDGRRKGRSHRGRPRISWSLGHDLLTRDFPLLCRPYDRLGD